MFIKDLILLPASVQDIVGELRECTDNIIDEGDVINFFWLLLLH